MPEEIPPNDIQDSTRVPVPELPTRDVAFTLDADAAGAVLAGKYKLVERIGEGGMPREAILSGIRYSGDRKSTRQFARRQPVARGDQEVSPHC